MPTQNITELLRENNNDIRLAKQFVFDKREIENSEQWYDDVSADAAIMKMPGLYHRYPGKVLIFPTEACFGECRFCFRKYIRQNNVLAETQFINILNYFKNTPSVNEVIFSGGDPLTLDNHTLLNMIERVRSIESIKIIRLHTRALTYAPERLDDTLIDFLAKNQPLFMVFHINSALELTHSACEKVKKLVENGILCFSQTALLYEVNDSEEDLMQLFVQLLKIRIKPYYLFHPDRVKGSSHFYVPLSKGISLYKKLFNRISGLAMPIYLLNIPNGGGHCLIDLNNIRQISDNCFHVTDWEGNIHTYAD